MNLYKSAADLTIPEERHLLGDRRLGRNFSVRERGVIGLTGLYQSAGQSSFINTSTE